MGEHGLPRGPDAERLMQMAKPSYNGRSELQHHTDRVGKGRTRRKIGNDLSPFAHGDVPEVQRRIVSDPKPLRFLFVSKTVRVSSLASDFATLGIWPPPVLGRAPALPAFADPDDDDDDPEDPISLKTTLDRYCTASQRPEPGSRVEQSLTFT
jgi:hypothetical protein